MNVFIASKTGIGGIISNHINKTCDKNAYTLKKIDTSIVHEKTKLKELSLNNLPITASDKIVPAIPSLLKDVDIEDIKNAEKVYLAFDTTPYGQHIAERVIKDAGVEREYLRIWPTAATVKNIQYVIDNAGLNTKYRHYAVYYQLSKSANYLVGMNISTLFNAIGKIYNQQVNVSISIDKLRVLKVVYEHYTAKKSKDEIKDRLSIYAHTKFGVLKWRPASFALNGSGFMTNSTYHYEILRKLTKAKTLTLNKTDSQDKTQPPPKPLTPSSLYAKIATHNISVTYKDFYGALKKLFYKGYILNPDGIKNAYNIEHRLLADAFVNTLKKRNHPLVKNTQEPDRSVFKVFKEGEHGALMPIYSSIGKSKHLKGLEREVYRLIVKGLIAQYLGDHQYRQITGFYLSDACNETFEHVRNKTIAAGWSQLKPAKLTPHPVPDNQKNAVIEIQKLSQKREHGDAPLTISDIHSRIPQGLTNAPQALESMVSQGYLKIEDGGVVRTTEIGNRLLKIIDKAPDFSDMLDAIDEKCKDTHTESGIGSSIEYMERKVNAYVVKAFRLLDSDTQGAQRCPECLVGYMVRKTTDKGEFAGCCNYPVCEYAEKSKHA